MQRVVEIKACGPVKNKYWTNLGWLLTSSLKSLATEIDEGMCSLEVCGGGMSLWVNIAEFYKPFLKPHNQLDFTCRLCCQILKGQTGKQANYLDFFFHYSL